MRTEKETEVLVLTEDDVLFMEDDCVDEAGLESFPASDPPPWTSGVDRVPGVDRAARTSQPY